MVAETLATEENYMSAAATKLRAAKYLVAKYIILTNTENEFWPQPLEIGGQNGSPTDSKFSFAAYLQLLRWMKRIGSQRLSCTSFCDQYSNAPVFSSPFCARSFIVFISVTRNSENAIA